MSNGKSQQSFLYGGHLCHCEKTELHPQFVLKLCCVSSPIPLGSAVLLESRLDKKEGRKTFISCKVMSSDRSKVHTETSGSRDATCWTDFHGAVALTALSSALLYSAVPVHQHRPPAQRRLTNSRPPQTLRPFLLIESACAVFFSSNTPWSLYLRYYAAFNSVLSNYLFIFLRLKCWSPPVSTRPQLPLLLIFHTYHTIILISYLLISTVKVFIQLQRLLDYVTVT